MVVEIVTTGSELLLGQVVNTNVAYMSKRLNDLGFDVVYQSTVGDNYARMEAVLRHALERADIVITSGGLGPTLGDITKEVSAKIFNRNMVVDEPSRELMEERFAKRGIVYTENNLRQVTVPEGADIFLNHNGIASGVAINAEGKLLVNLPGPPSEMKDMFERSLVPYLEKTYGLQEIIVSKVLNTVGIGESLLETKLYDLFKAQGNPTLALLIKPEGGVLIRITAKAKSQAEAESLIEPVEAVIRERVGEYIYGVENTLLEEAVAELLLAKHATVACAESCTGGMLASRLTSVSGSSEYINGSIVSYSNQVKEKFLKVDPAVLATEGAVCATVAEQMATGVKALFDADYGIGITGIAGPTGGSEDKPVGLVYISVATPSELVVTKNVFGGNREKVRKSTTQTALTLLREQLLRHKD